MTSEEKTRDEWERALKRRDWEELRPDPMLTRGGYALIWSDRLDSPKMV